MPLRRSPRCRLFRPGDRSRLRRLLDVFKPEIAGLRSGRLYEALARDAISNRDLVVIVAVKGSSLIGFNMTVIGRRRFIRRFVLRHPLLSLRIIAAKALNLRPKPSAEAPAQPLSFDAIRPVLSPEDSGRSWKDASPDIAKILWTGVREEHRGRRVSSGIGAYLLRVLKSRGVRRVDVLVDPRNLPSVRLTRALGFRMERRGAWIFGSLDFKT